MGVLDTHRDFDSVEENEIFKRLMSKRFNEKAASIDKKVKPSDRMLMELKNHGFNMSQLEDVLRQRGNQLIISSAGSGKTTALIFKIIRDLLTGETTKVVNINGNNLRVPEKIWVSTFLKTGADELESQMSFWQRELGVIDTTKAIAFSTIHAEFKRALNKMGVVTNIIDSAKNTKYLKEVLNDMGLKSPFGRELNSDSYIY